MRFASIDDRLAYILQESHFTRYTRDKSGTGDDYKSQIAEQTYVEAVIDDPKRVILNYRAFETPMFASLDEIFTQFYSMNPPLSYYYNHNLEKYYKLTLLNRTEYTYGVRWMEFRQLENLLKLFIERPDTKRGVVSIYTPYDTEPTRKDVPCTLLYSFLQRHHKLNMFIVFRSHDLAWGFKTDYVLASFTLQFLAKALSLLTHTTIFPGAIRTTDISLHYYPTKLANPLSIVESRYSTKHVLDVFTNTPYGEFSEMLEDLRVLKGVEETARAKNIPYAREMLGKLKDPALCDFGRAFINLNAKERLEEYTTMTFEWK